MNATDNKSNGNSIMANLALQVIQHAMISRYFAAAGLVIILYDTIITIEDEVRLVWSGPFAAPKLFYYINRYWTIAPLMASNYIVAGFRPPLSDTVLVSPSSYHLVALTRYDISCRVWVFVFTITALAADMASSAILILRVAALYDKTKWVGRGLWILSGLLYIITVALSMPIIKSFNDDFVYEPLSGMCLPVERPYKPYATFSIPLIFDIVIISLTVFRISRLAAALRKKSGAEILHTIFRDAVLCFVIVVALRIWSTIIWAAFPNSFMYLGVYLYRVMLSTMTSRLFLNLRSAGSSTPNHFQIQSVATLHLGSSQATPLETVQVTNGRTLTAANLDSTLFEMTSGVERGLFSDQEEMLSWETAETRPSDELSRGDGESQSRGV